MIGAALDAGLGASWVTGDDVYGNDPALRAALRDRRVGYVLAVSCDHRIPTNCGPVRADSVARGLPPVSWHSDCPPVPGPKASACILRAYCHCPRTRQVSSGS
jgi:hypothetical protein